MTDYAAIIENIKAYFEIIGDFDDVHFVTEFPDEVKAQPLKRPTVSIGIESIEDKKVEPVYSEDEPPVLLYNREATITLRFIIHIPQESSGVECYDLVRRIGEGLLDHSFSYDFEKLTAGEITYDRERGALLQTANITIKEYSVD